MTQSSDTGESQTKIPRSRVRHSTIEPLRSLKWMLVVPCHNKQWLNDLRISTVLEQNDDVITILQQDCLIYCNTLNIICILRKCILICRLSELFYTHCSTFMITNGATFGPFLFLFFPLGNWYHYPWNWTTLTQIRFENQKIE